MFEEEEKTMEEAYKSMAAGDYINAYYLFHIHEKYSEIDLWDIYNYDYALVFIRLGEYEKALNRLEKALSDEQRKIFPKRDDDTMVSMNTDYLTLLKAEDAEGQFFKPLPCLENRVVDYYQICIRRMMAYCHYKMGNEDMLQMLLFELVQEYGKENFAGFLKLVGMDDSGKDRNT